MFAHTDTRVDFKEGKNYIVGPIGSGKTELLQAISFALFGTCALRDKASTYKNIYVELCFHYKEETFLIKRKINDASFLILNKDTQEYEEIVNSTSIVNQKIINLLGYNYDIYLLSNYCQQKKLSYFSELTPVNRIKYIDKISGLEEAKLFLKYLDGKRKVLKDNINLLKDVTVEPKLSDGIDLSFDYESNITVLNNRLSSINSLYTEYNTLNSQFLELSSIKEPILTINEKDKHFIGIPQELINIYIEYITNIETLEQNIFILNNQLRDIPKIPPKYKNHSIEEIEVLIDEHNISIATNLDLNITCPSCKSNHKLKDTIPTPTSSLESHNINQLYISHEYLKSDLRAKENDLRASINEMVDKVSNLSTNPPVEGLNLLGKIELNRKINNVNQLYDTFIVEQNNYLEVLDKRSSIENDSIQLKARIDSILSSQSKDIQLKDLYIQYNTEKTLYLKQMELYLEAKDKLDGFNIELKLVTNLMKDIQNISIEISKQTIPLINYHASYFLNLLSKGRMSSIEITKDFDLIVDGYRIGVRSGGETDLASLAYRLSLSQSIIPGMLNVFIADEIDSSGGESDSNDIVEALDIISEKGFQIIMITHKDITNIENTNIIQL